MSQPPILDPSLASLPSPVADHPPTAAPRLASLDTLRGMVMILMALDHVRWFLSESRFDPTDLTQTTSALFLTRWVTHFCAPAFVFLAGLGAYLYGTRHGGRQPTARFLLTRGLWLIVIEFTVVRFGWYFNFDYGYLLAGVIWMLGACMVLLAPLIRVPRWWLAGIGLGIVALHDLLDNVTVAAGDSWGWLWQVLHQGGEVVFPPQVDVLFVLAPWVGVMAVGYALGPVLRLPVQQRNRILVVLGLGATALFVLLRATHGYGDPQPWSPQPRAEFAIWSFVNTNKYPASLQFLLMTLGPTVALLPLLERWRGRFRDAVATIGRVPFFYYVLHLPLIHLVAAVLSLIRYGHVIPWLLDNPPAELPSGYGYSLALVYLVWLGVVAGLYPLCHWFARLKSRRRDWWLSYL